MLKRRNNRGFTVTEIMVAIMIISVLAGLALPSYFRTVEMSRANEALTNLNIINMGEKIFRLNNPTFVAGNSIAALNAALNTDMSANFYTAVQVTINGGVSYTARFQRVGGGNNRWYQHVYNNATRTITATEGGTF